ncbi:MAG: glycine cleavage system protein GcvH [Spirochaetales bacterium]|nr:glycine cleavage system protein GcvH [Spirochaetales bacterium]
MNIPEHLKYTKSHEWVRLEGDTAYVGITDYAQHSLGDIVYVELPDVGTKVGADEELTTIESVKAAEPIYSPLAGSIAAVNEELNDKPEIINEKPYEAFIFAVKLEDKAACDTLMNAKEYGELVEAEGDD